MKLENTLPLKAQSLNLLSVTKVTKNHLDLSQQKYKYLIQVPEARQVGGGPGTLVVLLFVVRRQNVMTLFKQNVGLLDWVVVVIVVSNSFVLVSGWKMQSCIRSGLNHYDSVLEIIA